LREIGIGLIGTGFMGKAHALAYGAARAVLGDVPQARRHCGERRSQPGADHFG
jgi:hypothetical protein